MNKNRLAIKKRVLKALTEIKAQINYKLCQKVIFFSTFRNKFLKGSKSNISEKYYIYMYIKINLLRYIELKNHSKFYNVRGKIIYFTVGINNRNHEIKRHLLLGEKL